MVVGIPFFGLLIAGLILNTVFLVREVRRNERQDSFLNAVTHELKTPLASIRLYLDTLQRRDLSPDQRAQFYSIMLSDSDRLLATVEQVLKAGEVGQRAGHGARVPVNMAELLQEAVAVTLLRHHLAAEAITVETRSLRADDADTFTVFGDPRDLRIAVLNILDNAVKYSPDGATIRIVLSVESDAWVMLSISDRGVGIPAAQLKRVFRRFYRVPSLATLRVGGTGLGLFLVRTIARQHGGDAFAESPGEGRGATIHLQLPRLLAAGHPQQSVSKAGAA
jgi:two-component system sensor histidine kinase SenX3